MTWTFMPFRGLRYNTGKACEIAQVVAPPYDVISPRERDAFCDGHQFSIVHVELGREQPGDDEGNNKYTRAGAIFAEWEKAGVVRQDPDPAYYVYDQEFPLGERTLTRRAFFAALRLEPFGSRVLPHEETMPGPRADRLKLITACPVNLSPIFGIYPDARNEVALLLNASLPREPLASFVDFAGVRQTLWRIQNPRVLSGLSQQMESRRLYIADGHHRYETALLYRDFAIKAHGPLAPADARNFVMIACVSISDPGLVVLPAHRVIGGIPDFRYKTFLNKLSGQFDVRPVKASGAAAADALLREMSGKQFAFGFYADGKANLVTLKNEDLADLNPAKRSSPWKRLDVSILVWLILEQALGFTHEDLANPERVRYVKDPAEAAQLVDSGSHQLVCYLNPTRLDQLEQVAQAGERMPPKSTYFYPKLLTGLVMRKLL